MKRLLTKKHHLILILSFFAAIFSLRFFEWIFGSESLDLDLFQCFKSFLKDLLLTLQVFTIGSLITFIFKFFWKDHRHLIHHILNLSALLINYLLIIVFLKTKMPLDETIYRFSIVELQIITGGESGFGLSWLIFILLAFGIYFSLYRFLTKRIRKERRFPFQPAIIGLTVVLTWIVTLIGRHETNSISSDNLLSYFTQRSIKYAFDQSSSANIQFPKREIADMNVDFFGGKSVSAHYPFLHELPSESELGKHLHKSKNGPPNIVYIIVESLSSDFIGKYAHKTGHLMPFLDSLSNKSLYWPNTLSAYSRTVHVLPASLASAPFTSNGSHFQSLDYPNHLSLVSLLKQSHYSRFYCGVNLDFSDMRKFMNYQQTDYLVKGWEKQFSQNVDGVINMWGYPDGQMFEKSWVDYPKRKDPNKKRFDIFLTCSTHGPFIIPNKPEYIDRVKAKIARIKAPNAFQQAILERVDEYASFSYIDEQLQRYFERAKKEKDFENTIYVIFGDHGSELAYTDELSYFKIPLLIYSPLVKKPQQFDNIASQLDLPPTLLNYLKNEYQLQLPDLVSFLGRELPFENKIRRNRSLMLGFVGRKNKAFLDKEFYLFDNDLYKIDAELNTHKTDNVWQRDKMLKQIENGEKITDYVIYKDYIIPHNLFLTHYKHNKFTKVREYKHPETQQTDGEFIGLGERIPYKPFHKFIHVEVSYDVLAEENTQPKDMPSLIFSIEKPKETILWHWIPYQNQNMIRKNKWTHIKASAIYRISEIKNLKKNDQLHQYIWNQKHKNYRIKNLKYEVSYS